MVRIQISVKNGAKRPRLDSSDSEEEENVKEKHTNQGYQRRILAFISTLDNINKHKEIYRIFKCKIETPEIIPLLKQMVQDEEDACDLIQWYVALKGVVFA
jgi:hypothetical protein